MSSGIFIIQLVDRNNNVYNGGRMEVFYDIFNVSKIYKLTGSIYHNINDIVKVRFIVYDGSNLNTNVTLNIAHINIIIKK